MLKSHSQSNTHHRITIIADTLHCTFNHPYGSLLSKLLLYLLNSVLAFQFYCDLTFREAIINSLCGISAPYSFLVAPITSTSTMVPTVENNL